MAASRIIITFDTLMDALCKEGRVVEANGLLKLRIGRGENPDITLIVKQDAIIKALKTQAEIRIFLQVDCVG